jgi:membrane protein YdbS with pleckstrin-like domain
MNIKTLKVIVSIVLFLITFYCVTWIGGVVLIGILLAFTSHNIHPSIIEAYPVILLFYIALSIFITGKLLKHRRVKAFLNADKDQ